MLSFKIISIIHNQDDGLNAQLYGGRTNLTRNSCKSY